MTRLVAWRIIKTRYASATAIINNMELPAAFSGESAQRYPGRWNNQGIPMVYVASSQSLALLEILAHSESTQLLTAYSVFPVEFSSNQLINITTHYGLPEDWQSNPPAFSTRDMGSQWVMNKASLLLEVPSAIVANESNYLINPYHPDLAKLTIGSAQDFAIDHRLV